MGHSLPVRDGGAAADGGGGAGSDTGSRGIAASPIARTLSVGALTLARVLSTRRTAKATSSHVAMTRCGLVSPSSGQGLSSTAERKSLLIFERYRFVNILAVYSIPASSSSSMRRSHSASNWAWDILPISKFWNSFSILSSRWKSVSLNASASFFLISSMTAAASCGNRPFL